MGARARIFLLRGICVVLCLILLASALSLAETSIVLNPDTAYIDVYGVLNVTNNRIINLANPLQAQDAATKYYVDSQLSGQGGGWTDTGTLIKLVTPSDSINATSLFIDNTNGRVGVNMSGPSYALDVRGDVRWTGTLQGGTVPWASLSGHVSVIAGTGLTGGGALSGSVTLNANTSYLQKRVNYSCDSNYAIRVINEDGSVTCTKLPEGNVLGSGASGRIAFWSSETGLSSNANLAWDNSTQRLGIGTTSPTHTLTVVGTANITGAVYLGNTICDSGEVLSTNANGQLTCVQDTNSGGTITGSGTENRVAKFVDSAEIGDSIIFDNGTHVGIKITSPTATLDVNGTAKVSGVLTLGTQGTASGQAIHAGRQVLAGTGLTGGGALTEDRTISANTSYLQRRIASGCDANNAIRVINEDGSVTCQPIVNGTGASGKLAFWAGAAQIAYNNNLAWDNSTQRLGIGTTSPTHTLTVVGTANITGAVYLGNTVCESGEVLKAGAGGIVECVADDTGGSMSTWYIAASSGSPQGVSEGQTVTITGGTGITATAGETRNVTISIAAGGVNTTQLADNAVTFAKLQNIATLSVIGRSSSGIGDPEEITAGSDFQVLRRSGNSLAFGALNLSSTNAVTGRLAFELGGTGASSYGANRVIYVNSGNSAFTSSANFVFNGTSLAIGTSVPSKRLEVSDGSKGITLDPVANTPTINTTAGNLTIASAGGNVIIVIG